jgi:hypothetical protein
MRDDRALTPHVLHNSGQRIVWYCAVTIYRAIRYSSFDTACIECLNTDKFVRITRSLHASRIPNSYLIAGWVLKEYFTYPNGSPNQGCKGGNNSQKSALINPTWSPNQGCKGGNNSQKSPLINPTSTHRISVVKSADYSSLGTTSLNFNPLPVLFKALLYGQKDCVFFSGHLIYILKQERFRAFRPAGGV